jgi:multidrug efflux pump subunit AcrB
MLAGILVTTNGLMLVGFAMYIAGEYAGNIFWVVGIALITSWLVAVIFMGFVKQHIFPISDRPEVAQHADPRQIHPLRRMGSTRIMRS